MERFLRHEEKKTDMDQTTSSERCSSANRDAETAGSSKKKHPSTLKRQWDLDDDDDSDFDESKRLKETDESSNQNTRDDEFGYRCETCDFPLHITTDDIDEYEVHEALLNMQDDFYPNTTNRSISDNISVNIDCQNPECDEKVEVVVSVNAIPIFEDENSFTIDRPPKIDTYDIEEFELLPSGNDAFDVICNPDFIEEPDFDQEPYIEWYIPSPKKPSKQKLRIICKTKMGGGYCYMGLDEDKQRLLRPIFNTKPGACCWSKSSNFEVGSLVSFEVLHDPSSKTEADFKTSYPHRNEDMLVEKDHVVVVSENTEWSPKSLLPLAKTNILDVFSMQLVRENKYFLENTKCPSVGVFLTKENHLRVYTTDENKRRVRVDNGRIRYDWPLTALQWDELQTAGNRNCIVILGLARPWKGFKNQLKTPVCYILVIGIYVLGK